MMSRRVALPAIRRAFTLVLALLGTACADSETKPTESKSFWVRQNQKSRVIVFVHGVLGDARGSWTNTETGAFFPDLVEKEPTFADADIFVAGFPSPARRASYSIDGLTEKLYRDLKNKGVLAYEDIVFINHSMGGVVARAFVLKYEKVRPKVKMMQFFSTPMAGADLASFAAAFSNNRQFDGMRDLADNTYLQSQQSSWNAAGLGRSVKSSCAYEVLPTYGRTVVTIASATLLCTERHDPIAANHIDIVKPRDADDDPFVAFKLSYGSVYNIEDYISLTQANLQDHLEALSGSGPIRSFSVGEPIDLSGMVQDAQRWRVLNWRFESGGQLLLGSTDLSLTVRGRLIVPSSGKTLFASGWPGKPLPASGLDRGQGPHGAAGSGHNGQDGNDGNPGGPGEAGGPGTAGARSGDLSLVLAALPNAGFRVSLVGQNGGVGGNGGSGGNGGRGETGQPGKYGTFG